MAKKNSKRSKALNLDSNLPADKPVPTNQEFFEVEAIVDHRGGTTRENAKEYLVKWTGYDEKENSWEPKAMLEEQARDTVGFYWHRRLVKGVKDKEEAKIEAVLESVPVELTAYVEALTKKMAKDLSEELFAEIDSRMEQMLADIKKRNKEFLEEMKLSVSN